MFKKKSSISKLLIEIAKKIEQHPRFISDLREFVFTYSSDKEMIDIPIDIWALYGKGREEFEKTLKELTVPQLVKIIQKNNFDPTKLTHKSKNRERLIDLIINRMEDRNSKGGAFFDVGGVSNS